MITGDSSRIIKFPKVPFSLIAYGGAVPTAVAAASYESQSGRRDRQEGKMGSRSFY